MIQVLKSGVVHKKSQGTFNISWEERFLVLCNCGLLYFKRGEDQPKKFKSLNNFIVTGLTSDEEKKQGKSNMFKVAFNKVYVKKDMLISA